MTFKHEKFEDSATMRSLIKVAEQKGWVKNEPLKKTASIESFDLSPTSSLTENVLKLCSGLRKSGMNKYAEEIEKNFIVYKRAAEIYDVSKEKGEDLVDAAHPDGSHQLEGVSGDSVVETIVDRHLKMLEVIDKKPTGKTAQSIISSVRLVLAQTANNSEAINSFNAQIGGLMGNLAKIVKRIDDKSREEITFYHQVFPLTASIGVLSQKPTYDNLLKLKSQFGDLYSRLKPDIFGGMTEETWQILSGLFNLGNSYIASATMLRKKVNELQAESLVQENTTPSGATPSAPKPASTTVSGPSKDSIGESLDKILSRLNSFKAVISSKKLDNRAKAQGLKWIDDNIAEAEYYKTQFNNELGATEEELDKNKVILKYQSLARKLSGEINQFYKDWVVS